MEFKNERYIDGDIKLDWNEFVNCQFINCKLRYSGGPVKLGPGCVFDKPQFMLEGAAFRTMELLGILYQASPSAIEQIFECIRKIGPTPSDSVTH